MADSLLPDLETQWPQEILSSVRSLRLLVTGATGMTGQWCLSQLNHIAAQEQLKIPVLIVSRRQRSWLTDHLRRYPQLQIDAVGRADLASAVKLFSPSHVWHFSADTSSSLERSLDAHRRADLDVARSILDATRDQTSAMHFLYTSSGAVYGRNRLSSVPVTEDHPTAEIEMRGLDPYDRVKLETEQLLSSRSDVPLLTTGICRLFAFVGPLVPTDRHFAIGNFLGNAARGEPIVMHSSGLDFRSWLYCADLARYIVCLTFKTQSYVVNIGSDESMSIREAAHLVAAVAGVTVKEGPVDQDAKPRSYYLPDISRLRTLVPLRNLKSFEAAIRTTLSWLRINN